MRWYVLGANGMLGQDLVTLLAGRGEDVLGLDRGDVDLTSPETLNAPLAGADVIVNCAAYTAVDAAESDEAAAFAVNATGATDVARVAREVGARLVHISTDYVFAGDSAVPYGETDPPAPRSAYGRTKVAGEWGVRAETPDHLVVRTAWLYGAHGPCFPRTIARAAAERGALDVVGDQVGQPTWTVDLADLVHRLVGARAPAGIYHGTSSGRTSWHGFAQAVAATAGLDPTIIRETSSDAYLRPAPRPAYSVLGHRATVAEGLDPIGDWAARWTVAGRSVLGL